MAGLALYGVIGNPIAHSLSPVMHNAAFKELDLEAYFTAFQVADLKAALTGVRALGIAGLSVTLPHKTEIIPYLDWVDASAQAIAAVNTVVNRQGQLCGYNTDATGALAALQAKVTLAGRRVLVVGAGGAARALVYGLVKAGAQVAIVNRTPVRGLALAEAFAVQYLNFSESKDFEAEILVNTTSLGMTPASDQLAVPEALLVSPRVVMDIVYNPLHTRLLAAAQAKGAQIIDGLEMFIGQGALQFTLWTGQTAPLAVMRQAVLKQLSGT
ncbi:MAG: shikimate dehydrogenase [Deltaproteobacteria bacterium]|nr:shikimate dehydrogenase [Deltaproteobacteria bacterium]